MSHLGPRSNQISAVWNNVDAYDDAIFERTNSKGSMFLRWRPDRHMLNLFVAVVQPQTSLCSSVESRDDPFYLRRFGATKWGLCFNRDASECPFKPPVPSGANSSSCQFKNFILS